MVKHGKQSNDAITQTALKQIKFGINLSDVSSVDKITLNIWSTLMRDLSPEARANPQLQVSDEQPITTKTRGVL